MFSQQLDLLDSFVQISDQGMSQLHLISEASHVVVASSGQNYSSRSFSSAQEVAVLRMCHFLIRLMTQDGQCFMGCLSHASLERPPWCRGLDQLMDVADTISHRYEFPRSSLRVPMKSGGSVEPSARSTIRRVLRK
jgi:hypothetical protein